ncbi:MAG: hypothetical protein ACOX81_04870 [Candidatus Heteroscillospira sp.]|jgi:hypothetical protein
MSKAPVSKIKKDILKDVFLGSSSDTVSAYEEQGIGRVTFFCHKQKKSEQSELCSDLVREAGLEPARA